MTTKKKYVPVSLKSHTVSVVLPCAISDIKVQTEQQVEIEDGQEILVKDNPFSESFFNILE